MRFARFRDPSGRSTFGTVLDEEVVTLDHRVPSFQALLVNPDLAVPRADDPRLPTSDVAWKAPIVEGAKIFCVGFNYAAHAAESGRDLPSCPTLFVRFGDTFVGAGRSVVRPPESHHLDWEGEVALVLGRAARRVVTDTAVDCIAGFTCMAENSIRDWQQHSSQATAGKNWASSGALGPWVVTRDEAGDGPFDLVTRLNGAVVQHDSTDRLVFSFAELISYISTFTPLRPGDVIATGTPKGIGARMQPPRFLRPGDEVEVEVSGVGILRNGVVDEVTAPIPVSVA